MSPVFAREKGYVFKVYSNEEERMHIHVIKDRKSAKFWLEPEIELSKNSGFSNVEIHEIKRIINVYANHFRKQYKEHIGKRVDD